MSVNGNQHDPDDELARFCNPWEFENALGVPEIPFSEIKCGEHLGTGKKSRVQVATWKGQRVALKCWMESTYQSFAQWELVVYTDLKAVQGVLVPKLYFCSSMANGARVLGLQIGEPVSHAEDIDSSGLQEDLSKVGWRQREMSFRRDNVVWLQQEDGTKRLASIDLESFVPSPDRDKLTKCPFRGSGVFGIPEISPAEVHIKDMYDPFNEWTASRGHSQGSWLGKPISILWMNEEICLKHLHELKDVQGELIPKPLFVTKERSGRILLGCEPLKKASESETSDFDAKQQDLDKGLASLGWKRGRYVELAWTTEKRLIVLHMSSLIKLTAEEQASMVTVVDNKGALLPQDLQELVDSGSFKPTSGTESLHGPSDCPDLHECTSTSSSTLPRLDNIQSISQESASSGDSRSG